MLCYLNTKAFNDLVSASVSDSGDKCSDFVNGSNNPEISAIYIRRRTSNTGPRQEEQHANGNSGGQLKVGPTHRVSARAPSTNGESWTFFFYIVRNVETKSCQ